jgi:acetyl-CoA C-acetyltransferase
VRGLAGEHQVEGAKVAVAQAYGASAQYFSMWIVGSSLDAVS